MNRQTKKDRQYRTRAAFTLVELLIATTTATVLVGGLGSSLYIASQSLEVGTQARGQSYAASSALAMLHRDLQSATKLTELTIPPESAQPPEPTEHAITIEVPDRNEDGIPETIRYAWSGIIGDSLTQKYNEDDLVILARNVQAFSLLPAKRMLEGLITQPNVLFVSGQDPNGEGHGYATPGVAELACIELMRSSWGYRVTVLSQQATQTEIDAAIPLTNVIFIAGGTDTTTLGAKFSSAPIGVVTESYAYAKTLGFYAGTATSTSTSSDLEILQTNHYITENYTLGDLTVFSANQTLKSVNVALASGVVALANVSVSPNHPTFLIIERGDLLANGDLAPARRCQLPWGASGFSTTALSTDGQIILRRAIRWCAGAGSNQPIFKSCKTAKQGSRTMKRLQIDVPDNLDKGDLMIAAIAVEQNSKNSLEPPSGGGWNELQRLKDSANKVTLGVWWKLAEENEPTAHTFTWGSDGEAYGWIMRFTGHDPTNPIPTYVSKAGTSKLKTPPTPAVTTENDRCLIVRIGGFHHGFYPDLSSGDMASYESITAGASTLIGAKACGGAACKYLIRAGNTGTADFKLILDHSEEYCTLTLAIQPAHLP